MGVRPNSPTLAAVAFAGLLVVIIRFNEVRGILTDLVCRALTVRRDESGSVTAEFAITLPRSSSSWRWRRRR